MAIAFGAVGTAGNGTTSVSPALPASISAGDLLVMWVVNKYPPNGPATPAGWTLLLQAQGGAGAAGADTGEVFITVYWRIATGAEGAPTVTITSGNAASARIGRWSKASNKDWSISSAKGSDNVGAGNWSVTADGNPGVTVGDVVLAITGVNCDGVTWTGETLAATGATFGSAERDDANQSNGDDCGRIVSEHACSAGTASDVATYTANASANGVDFPAGATVFMRLREVDPPVTAAPPGGGTNIAGVPGMFPNLFSGVS